MYISHNHVDPSHALQSPISEDRRTSQRLASLERHFQPRLQPQGLLPSRLGVYENPVPHSSPHVLWPRQRGVRAWWPHRLCASNQLLQTLLPSCPASHLSPHQSVPSTPSAGKGQGMVPSTTWRGSSPSFLASWQDKAWPIQANNLVLGKAVTALLELQTSLLKGPPARPAPSVILQGRAASSLSSAAGARAVSQLPAPCAPSTELVVLASSCSALGFRPPCYFEHQQQYYKEGGMRNCIPLILYWQQCSGRNPGQQRWVQRRAGL